MLLVLNTKASSPHIVHVKLKTKASSLLTDPNRCICVRFLGNLGKCEFEAETSDDFQLTVPCPADVDGALASIYPRTDFSKPQYVWSDSQGYYVLADSK